MDKEILTALEDSVFAEKIIECISPEEVQGYFEEIGINITEEDANTILCSVYGVKGETAFTNDYDMALVAGGKSEKEGNKIGPDANVTEVLVGSVGADKLTEKIETKKKKPLALLIYGAPKIEEKDK